MNFLMQISAYDRVEAVHETFARKSVEGGQDMVQVMWMLVAILAAFAFLSIAYRVQKRRQHNQEEHRLEHILPRQRKTHFGTLNRTHPAGK